MILHGKKFWIWIWIPLFCYIVENILRYRNITSHKYGETYIEESYVLPSKVTHLIIKKPPKFRFNSGDYIFINIPTIAKYEWHPFSISSAPERSDYLWLHIKAVGNWTNKLHSFSMSSKFDVSLTSANRSKQSNPGCIMRTTLMQQEIAPIYQDDNVEKINVHNCSKDLKGEKVKFNLEEKKVCFESDINKPAAVIEADFELAKNVETKQKS
jgi:hypothetical protein